MTGGRRLTTIAALALLLLLLGGAAAAPCAGAFDILAGPPSLFSSPATTTTTLTNVRLAPSHSESSSPLWATGASLTGDALGPPCALVTGLDVPGKGVRRLPGEGFSLDDPLGRINPLNRRMRVEFEGVEVRGVRDLTHLSDRDAWKMYRHGSAATDIHGDRLIVHHYRQNPHGFMVEVPESYHSVWNPRQHPFGNTKGTGLTQAERDLFNIWRKRYWKARGRDLLIQRGLL